MSCCCPHSRSAGRFFSFFARRYRKRFEKRGFEHTQKQLLAGIKKAGFDSARILEIGSGVGHLHQTLLEQGAASATGIDLASEMIREARDWARVRGLDERVEYLEGDFMDMLARIAEADVTVLDKVVCCYPDADGLVHRSLDKTGRVYALTYPRWRWITRVGVLVGALMMKLLRSDFRPYVHDPRQVEAWICEAGFEKQTELTTFLWLTQVYVKHDRRAGDS
jgi:magnesium-protoporphyrin O-methyltransferase